MDLYRQRLFGIALTTIGFVMAALAGLALASQVNSLGSGGLFAGAGLAFAVVLPFLGAGIFFYARGSREADEAESTLPQQVQLNDLMKMRQVATLDGLAAELNATPQDVLNMVHELAQLKLFSGYLTPEAELHRIEPIVVQQMTKCQRCSSPLVLDSTVSVCMSCGTEYYPVSSPIIGESETRNHVTLWLCRQYSGSMCLEESIMGNNEIYNQIVSQRGTLENLIAKIPGFRGYHEKNARREADRLVREYLANEIERLVKVFGRVENKMLDAGGMKYMTRTREIKAKIQAYTERVQTANPGYSAMFAEVKIGNEELDRIYAFDEAQMQYVHKIETALDGLEDAVKKGDDFADALDAVETAAVEANDAFELRDDEILKLSEKI